MCESGRAFQAAYNFGVADGEVLKKKKEKKKKKKKAPKKERKGKTVKFERKKKHQFPNL